MISRNTIDQVYEASRVEEVIGDFISLKKSGSNFKGLSPFSQERTPSFMVSPVKQIWKDFSSGKGGNVVAFLMEHEHFTYPESIEFLAKKYNIEIEKTEQSSAEKEKLNQRESLYLVNKFAQEQFSKDLWEFSEGMAIGLSYFRERGFSDDTIRFFGLGYSAQQRDHFFKTSIKAGYLEKNIINTGLVIKNERGAVDRFRGRVIFPIRSMAGRIQGFGGRILSSTLKTAKYLNSPESDIYHKSKILYGLFQAKKEIAKKDNCFLVEGYTDVISFHQSGVENVVASSGTALSSDQIRLVNRLTKNITVLFDGDAAGIRASIRGIDIILEQGMNVKVVQFPDGEDPDSFAKSHSDSELKEYLNDSAQDFISFKASLLLKDSKNDPVKKAGVIRDIVTSISKIPDGIQREVYVQECARIMDISERVLFSELAQILKKESSKPIKNKQLQDPNQPPSEYYQEQEQASMDVVKGGAVSSSKIDQLSILEKEIIKILLLYGNEEVDFIEETTILDDDGKESISSRKYQNLVSSEIYLHLQDDEIEFSNDIFQEIYNEMIHQLNQSQKLITDAFINHENSNISNTVTSILMDEEKHLLSNWESKNIEVKSSLEVLRKSVNDAVFNLRRILIGKKIEDLIKESISQNSNTVNLDLIKNYTGLKMRLFSKLNRVV